MIIAVTVADNAGCYLNTETNTRIDYNRRPRIGY